MKLTTILLVYLCSLPISSYAGTASKARAVTTSQATNLIFPRYIETQGVIAAWQEAIVSARISGAELTDIHVAVGDHVKRGQLLANFDDRSAKADFDKASAQESQTRINFTQAETDQRRMQELKKQGAVSAQAMAHADAQFSIAQSQLLAAIATTRSAKIRLDDTKLIAPDAGVITARSAMIGQVPPLGTELFRLIRKERLEWRAEVNAAQMNQIKIGKPVKIRLADGQITEGKVRQLSAALENTTRLGIAYIDLQQGNLGKAGMIASGRIELSHEQAISIPSSSLSIRDGRHLVFRVIGNQVKQTMVTPGQYFQDKVEIQKGLNLNDVVVVEGAAFLSDGEQVQIVGQNSTVVKK